VDRAVIVGGGMPGVMHPLTIGDMHSYDEPFAFDVDEAAYDHLRGRAAQFLGEAQP
jgi:hypothetical protein